MKTEIRTQALILVLIALCMPTAAGDRDLVTALVPGDITGARINLNPGGLTSGSKPRSTVGIPGWRRWSQ